MSCLDKKYSTLIFGNYFTQYGPKCIPYMVKASSPEVAAVSDVTESTRSIILAFIAWTGGEKTQKQGVKK